MTPRGPSVPERAPRRLRTDPGTRLAVWVADAGYAAQQLLSEAHLQDSR